MAVTEYQRHEVFKWFEETMGPERAAIMMDLLPPVGWGDVATTSDLAILRNDLQTELRVGLADVRGEIQQMRGDLIRSLFFGMVASNATLVAMVFAAVRLGA